MVRYHCDGAALKAIAENDTDTLWQMYGCMMQEGGMGTPLVPISTHVGQKIITKLYGEHYD